MADPGWKSRFTFSFVSRYHSTAPWKVKTSLIDTDRKAIRGQFIEVLFLEVFWQGSDLDMATIEQTGCSQPRGGAAGSIWERQDLSRNGRKREGTGYTTVLRQ